MTSIWDFFFISSILFISSTFGHKT